MAINSTYIYLQSPLILTHWTQKRQQHMTLEIQVLAWDRHTNDCGVRPDNGIPPFLITGLNQLIGHPLSW